MSLTSNSAESWKKIYEAFQQINFAAWDYDSVKKSLIDYLKLYYPEENFNDYIESSELVPIIELFAYFSELYAYRSDMNAHENIFIDADRKESVLRQAKLISYNVNRNIPARGLVKVTSISTTEQIFDSKGNELTNRVIKWGDKNNSNWKDQFIIVMNKVLEQIFGSVIPSDRVQVQDTVFELYGLNNNPLKNNVIPYNASISSDTFPMELVSAALNQFGPYEKRPENNMSMNILYLSDGLGDSSDYTGFFFFTKQGTLQRTTTSFDGVTPNQTYDILIDNINDTDVWVNNVDSDDNIIVGDGTTTDRQGAWRQVDVANSQNIIFNTNPNRNKYEIETLAEDKIRLIFGDGNFSDIPSGTFDIWTRISVGGDLIIPTNSIQNKSGSFTYYDNIGKLQTFKFSFSLLDSIQNSAPSEDIDHIKRIAPAVYYTQDRMVNGRDYNEFMLQDNSILKLHAINRTFSGDSKYIEWHDPNGYYDNVKMFSDDGVLYFDTSLTEQRISSSKLPMPDYSANALLTNSLVTNYIEPLLSSQEFFTTMVLNGTSPNNIRTLFTNIEKLNIRNALANSINNPPQTIWLMLNNVNTWIVYTNEPSDWIISVEIQTNNYWNIILKANSLIIHSDSLRFWSSNNDIKTITYDTLNSNYDQITILAANIGTNNSILTKNYLLNVLRQYIFKEGENKGQPSVNDLIVVPGDENGDGIPDYVNMSYIIPNNSYVYFNRSCTNACPWVWIPYSDDVLTKYQTDVTNGTGLWKRERGSEGINFLWMHRTPRYHLVDPSPSNIIDMYIVTRGYYLNIRQWLNGKIESRPKEPTSFELMSNYSSLIQNKMVSDTVILHSGKFKIMFGDKASRELQATFKVIRSDSKVKTDNQIKTSIVDAINSYFDINKWNFGKTFYFTDLASYIKKTIPNDIISIVLVPTYNTHVFGDLFQVYADDDEIIQPSVSVTNVDIVDSLNPEILRQF